MPPKAKIHVPALGTLAVVANSPAGETFWAGTFRYDDDGTRCDSRFFLCVRSGHEPAPAQCDFASKMLAAIDQRIHDARQLLKDTLAGDPALFGIDAAGAARYLSKGDALLPFAVPEPTFFEPGDWQLRFAESPLPSCAAHGVAVAFVGTRPDHVEDLSESAELS